MDPSNRSIQFTCWIGDDFIVLFAQITHRWQSQLIIELIIDYYSGLLGSINDLEVNIELTVVGVRWRWVTGSD